jgi:hypothetical protein
MPHALDDSEEYYSLAEELCRDVMERELPGPVAIPYEVEIPGTTLVGIRVTQDFEILDKYRSFEERISACCVCGHETAASMRQAVRILAAWSANDGGRPFRTTRPAWVHPSCFASCPETSEQRKVVW